MTRKTSPQPVETPAGAVPRKRRVAILGFGSTVKDCPWQDETWELWGMNGFWRAAKPDYGIDVPEERYSLWWDMHTPEFTRAYGKAAGFGDAQERWLEKEHPFPVFMLEADPAFPSVQRFPIEALVEAAGRDYFTSTVAYALAWALVQGDVAEVGLWGIDLVHASEYGLQRPCAEYWIGRCEAAGIKVTVHDDSALMKGGLLRYGYEAPNPLLREMRNYLEVQSHNVQGAMAKHKEAMEKLVAQMHTDDGAHQMLQTMLERLAIWERGGKL